jgi:hypothetical protein
MLLPVGLGEYRCIKQIITSNIQIINNPNYCAPLAYDFLTSLGVAPFPMFAPCAYGGLEL